MPTTKRVVVVGLDGLEPTIVDRLLQAGELPSLARLRASGGYSRIATTLPAQTPVAWSSFSTGTNPGGHGIFDFLRRDARTYRPDLSLSRFERRSMLLPPKAINQRRGTPFWEYLTQGGVPSTVLRMPCTFPPDKLKGRMLSGMGVPDIRGGLGTSTLFTTAGDTLPGESEQVVQLTGRAPFRVGIPGPRGQKAGQEIAAQLVIDVDASGPRVTVTSEAHSERVVLAAGQWSEWVRLKFSAGPLQSSGGMVRLLLLRSHPHVEVYASPVNFDPASPLFPISHPWDYANALSRAIGRFHTTGMVEDHGGLTNGRLDEESFLAQCGDLLVERERMLQFELNRMAEGFLFCLFDTPDRLQHMFWRFHEPNHPANRAFPTNGDRYRSVIDDHYRACDAIVGRVLDRVDDDTLCMVLSDHGFTSFQRGVHVNSWLHANGYLALRRGVDEEEGAGEFFRNVDWGRTKAYALGIGSIYLNVKGREAEGVVERRDAESLAAQIAAGLSGLRDDERNAVAIRGVSMRRDVYSGLYADESPDLVIKCSRGYRSSWTTALGGVAGGLFEDNSRRWGGDHIVDPELVPGVVFMNRPFRGEGVNLVDMAPTILAAFGLDKGSDMEGGSVLST